MQLPNICSFIFPEIGKGRLTVGKIYGGLLILENWKATKFGRTMSGDPQVGRAFYHIYMLSLNTLLPQKDTNGGTFVTINNCGFRVFWVTQITPPNKLIGSIHLITTKEIKLENAHFYVAIKLQYQLLDNNFNSFCCQTT